MACDVEAQVIGDMFALGKKKVAKDLLVSVCPNSEGIALACVRRDKDLPPALEQYDFKPAEGTEADLKKIVKSRDLDDGVGVSVLELGSYSLMQVEAPDVQPDELKAAIRWKVKDLLDFHIDDAVIDVFEAPESGSARVNKKMYVVAARSSLVKQRIDSLIDAGLRLEVIDIPEMALRNIAALLPEDVNGVALLYIEKNEGLITITRQDTLYLSRRIRFGYDALPGTAIHADDREAIEAWLDNIIIEVQRSLDYYESHFSQPQISGLVITPIDREIPGMTEYLAGQLGTQARFLDVNEIIDVAENIDRHTQSQCLLAIGAALRQESVAL